MVYYHDIWGKSKAIKIRDNYRRRGYKPSKLKYSRKTGAYTFTTRRKP